MTLVELLLTVALLGIMASITVPRLDFGAIRRAEVRTTAQNLGGALRLARSLAVADAGGNAQGYTVSMVGSTYTLTDAGTSTTVKGPVAIPDGITVSGDAAIRFDRLGDVADGTGKSLTVSGYGRTAQITVSVAGGIRVTE